MKTKPTFRILFWLDKAKKKSLLLYTQGSPSTAEGQKLVYGGNAIWIAGMNGLIE